jgi:hypothetical protein
VLLLLKNLLFTILVPGTVAFYLPHAIGTRGSALSGVGPGRWLIAAPLLLIGTAIYLWCLWDFATAGRGTPAPIDPPKELVVRGLYRTVRNPMYVGVLTAITAAPFRSWTPLGYAIAVGSSMGFVVLVEGRCCGRRAEPRTMPTAAKSDAGGGRPRAFTPGAHSAEFAPPAWAQGRRRRAYRGVVALLEEWPRRWTCRTAARPLARGAAARRVARRAPREIATAPPPRIAARDGESDRGSLRRLRRRQDALSLKPRAGRKRTQ